MEFALSEDQRLLQSSVGGTLGEVSSLDAVRRFAAGEATGEPMTAALSALGTDGLLVPECHDGLGLGALDAALVQEALGAHVSPAHFMAGSALAVAAIGAAGSPSEQADWLPRIASGEVRFAVALNEAVSRRDGAGLALEAGKLSGTALFAMELHGATQGLACDAAGRLVVFDITAPGLASKPLRTIDRTRIFSELNFNSVPARPLTGEDAPGPALDRTLALGRVLLAADTLGAAQAMLDQAVAYAKERKQFGRVIGSFQAVKHMCAEMAARLEPARALVWHAAHVFDAEPERASLFACLAKSHLSETGTVVAKTSTEVHGGMGFTDIVGLHYWFKRIGANRQLLGSPELLRAEAAMLQSF